MTFYQHTKDFLQSILKSRQPQDVGNTKMVDTFTVTVSGVEEINAANKDVATALQGVTDAIAVLAKAQEVLGAIMVSASVVETPQLTPAQ